jgi:hypothetical protein
MNNTSLKTGWLSPNGDFYPCKTYEHIATAMKILNDETANRADETLYNCGYVSITISQLGTKNWRIHWEKFLTEQQIAFLRPYFEDVMPVNSITNICWEREIK